jgi:hypothetical protein
MDVGLYTSLKLDYGRMFQTEKRTFVKAGRNNLT